MFVVFVYTHEHDEALFLVVKRFLWNEFLRLLCRFFFGGGGDFALIYFGNKSVNTLKRTPYNGQKLVNLRNEFFLQRLFDVSNLLHSGFMHDLHSTYKHVCKSSKFDKSCRPSRQNITLTFTGFTV